MRFEKFGTIRYIGHLDIMRYFHKALQRAHVDVSFSTGFHPHPIMSFASPLGVGLTSSGEYMDVEIGSCSTGAEMMDAINAQMVPGMKVTGIRLLPDEGRKNNAMATVGQADYRVTIPGMEARDWGSDVEHFLAQKEILVHKKTKKSEKDVDIREWILSLAYEAETASFVMRLTAGSMNNLKPELVMEALFRYLELPMEGSRMTLEICRLDMLTEEGVSLGELGEEILAPIPAATSEGVK